ncbi:MAG: YggS family pyridoxal phosphate-dependent enzyme [Solirubrobacterales bacterium]|nr:YggS family pyridoxal phosphate-dependent enzyme [Solirubrobacterales bacterium]
MIRANIAAVRARIDAASESAGRDPGSVRLLLATKTQPLGPVRVAIEAGETLVAENRVQEVRPKFEALEDLEYERHFIGHLQSNKINALVPYISCLQSLDRISLALKLQKRLEREDEQLDVLLQVNTSREDSKFGLDPAGLADFATEVSKLDRLHVKGLMTIGLFTDDQEKARPSLRQLRELRDEVRELNLEGVEMNELSMGMSGDLEVAIEEGSTIVRVGSAIFGSRETSDSDYWPGSANG